MAITPPTPIVLPWATDGLKNAIPVDSQIGINNGAASYTDGFPPLNMTPINAGGIPPAGKDFNGILYALTGYCQWLQAGGHFQYDAALVAVITGYPIGATLQSSVDPLQFWTNTVALNALDPDVDNTGWISSIPLYAAVNLTAGVHNDVVLPGVSDYAIDYTLGGAADVTGYVARRNGQRLYLSNVDASDLLQLLSNNVGSAAANRIRGPADIGAIQNQTITLQYFTGAARWLFV